MERESQSQFTQDDVSRYSRQMILPEIGLLGQALLKNGSVLIVGAGGLGCPAMQYLGAAGVGRIGVVDYDKVETSNLHRQVLHTEAGVKDGVNKVTSAAQAIKNLNSKIIVDEFCLPLDRTNAFEIISQYDVVLDATDNVPSRYLLNDVCVLAKKPLISGSALRWEGQLTIYSYTNNDGTKGPCYRCLYPKPPPPATVTNCSDGGVIGVVPGIIGSLQALEAIKIITGILPSYHKKLLVFDGFSGRFRTVKLREAQSKCIACGLEPTLSTQCLPDYEQFCGSSASDKCKTISLLTKDKRISATHYKSHFIDKSIPHVLVDVREPVELQICSLPNPTNISIKQFEHCQAISQTNKKVNCESLPNFLALNESVIQASNKLKPGEPVPIIAVCRLGNDSQRAVDILEKCVAFNVDVTISDIRGGIMAWARNIDPSFFVY